MARRRRSAFSAARCWASVALGAALASRSALRVRHDRARYLSGLIWSSAGAPVASSPVALVVQKFGGTSVADPDRIRQVADHVARTAPPRRRGRRRRQRHGQGDRRAAAPRRARSSEHPARPRDGHAHHRRRAQGHRAAVHGAARPRRRRPTSFTGSQAGFITDTTHTNAKILEVRADRVREALDAGPRARRRRRPGRVDRPRRHLPRAAAAPTPPPWRWPTRSSADVCELYTDVSGVFTADPRVVPDARTHGTASLRRDARDDRHRLPQAGDAVGRVRPHATACRLHVRSSVHLGAGHLGHRGGSRPWSRPSSRPSSHDTSEAKVTVAGVPDRPGIAAHAVPRAGRPSTSTST